MLRAVPGLSPRQKAAVVVRVMLADGADLDLSRLPPELQALLAQEMAGMELVDRDTCDRVIAEFCGQLEAVGVTFPGSIDGTLDIIGAHLSADTNSRLRRIAALNGSADPWDRIAALPPAQLAELARTEAIEVAAVMFTRLPVARASEVFGLLDPALARQIAYAMSLTAGIEAPALRRIGLALMRAVDALPRPAIEGQPVEKVGAILNFAPALTRDTVLAGLDQDDADFAGRVRRTIFTWATIPRRIDPRDIPRVIREVDAATITKALAGATGENAATVEFLLSGLSTRLADSMREEMEGAGKVTARDAEEAMSAVVAAIRRMEQAGELFLIVEDDEGTGG
ncbi:flagellar motor switch protein FliG [Paracoccus sp. MC1862]|uniref:flagellar motor switch protein FliG n=1 Tax=Paracoccus sp. MC1862 TaxID=2760307 RepID=UPI0016025CA5|nr:FliG C-terminal domain-containing protein [Paracoccus sp. MC1862]MBB1497303.1 flagellar motor switch protein FliG [Paracoccus sp. MC1862]QQO44731.1 flagellar motor switch protein FliG [Paracoccus sp. MC1862]